MEHRTIDEVGRAARIVPVGIPKMCRRERLERWATLLMQHPQRPLKPFTRIEFMSEVERARLHGEDTPLTIAYRDPLLRKEGLAGDTLGDALAFFDLSERVAHYILCDCHYQGTMSAALVAKRILSIAGRVTVRELWRRMCGTAGPAYQV